MPKLSVLDAEETERLPRQSGFAWVRSKGSHRIDQKDTVRVVGPFHAGKSLRAMTAKAVMEAIGEPHRRTG